MSTKFPELEEALTADAKAQGFRGFRFSTPLLTDA